MAKKLLCVVISVLMVVSLLPMGVMAASQETIDGVVYDVYEYTLSGATGWQNVLTLTSTEIDLLETPGAIFRVEFTDTLSYLWGQLYVHYPYSQDQIGSTWQENWSSSYVDIEASSIIASSYWSVADYIIFNAGDGVYVSAVKILVPAGSAGESTSRTNGVIYVNEEYHGVLLTRTSDGGETYKTYLACVPHTVASNGYCTVCHMYIGTDDESSTITVDGVEYEAAFSSDVNFASNDWNTTTLGDESFINALSTEGALLVITRDTETIVSYVSGEVWDKFFVGANYQYVYLSTVGTSTDDEDDLVAFLSDDGTTVVYDGATVYAALEAAGLTDSTSYTLGTNSSETYTITNVSVYVPAGTIVAEDVDVEEPVESTDTETEEDGDDLTVDDGDEVETPAETNPTTGVALALVPMAIAGLAVVSSKRR